MIEDLRVLDSLLWMLAKMDLKMRMSSTNSVCSAMISNSLFGYPRAVRDFLGMLRVLERVVPHPECFVCLSNLTFHLSLWVARNYHGHGSCKLRGLQKKIKKKKI